MVKIYGYTCEQKVIGKTCDCCKQSFYDIMELQEFLSWSDTGGYANRHHGDMTLVELDLCQDCVAKILGPYIRILGDPAQGTLGESFDWDVEQDVGC